MGIFDSAMKMFSSAETTQSPATKPAAPGAQQQVESLQIEPGKSQQQATQDQVKDPLEPFKDLWKTNEVKDGQGTSVQQTTQQQQPVNQQQQPLDYSAAAKKIDFSRLIPQELMTKAMGGDAGAFSQVMNTITQASFAAALRYADQSSAKSAKSIEDKINSGLSSKFKEFSLQNTPSKNPVLKHSSFQPVVAAIKAQMQVKFPDASVEELQEQAENYLSAVFESANKGSDKTQEQQANIQDVKRAQEMGNYDWVAHFEGKPS